MSRKNRQKIKSSGYDRCNICSEQIPLHEHHIHGHTIKNPNNKDNLAYICANCHVRVHTGDLILEGWFLTSEGRKLIWHKCTHSSVTGKDAIVYNYKQGK